MNKKQKQLNKKGIGDTTSFTIPEKFTHVTTGEQLEVSDVMLDFINSHIGNRNLVHALMSAIYEFSNDKPAAENVFVEDKLNQILMLLQNAKVETHVSTENDKNHNITQEITDDELDSILNDFA